MHFLLVNDDGIQSPNLALLAKAALKMGRVTIVAPETQMSGMSQGMTLGRPLTVKRVDYPVDGVTAYSCDGKPADCVKVGLSALLIDDELDFVFSGINNGYNAGYDVAYSGTVGAAEEALMHEIPAIAWSCDKGADLSLTRKYLLPLMEELTQKPLADGIWNVNFPNCPVEECKGIRYDCRPAEMQLIWDGFFLQDQKMGDLAAMEKAAVDGARTLVSHTAGKPGKGTNGAFTDLAVPARLTTLAPGESALLWNAGTAIPGLLAEPGTDVYAIVNNYISVGKVRSEVMEVRNPFEPKSAEEILEELNHSEKQIEAGLGQDAKEAVQEIRERHGFK